MKLTQLQKKILNEAQLAFPVAAKPYAKIARKHNLPEEVVIDFFNNCKKRGLIRRTTPSFDVNKIKRKSVLAAAKIPENKIKEAADFINKYPEVTHNYLRSNKYNIWFTIAAPSCKRVREIKKEIEGKFNIKLFLAEAVKKYKMNFCVKV